MRSELGTAVCVIWFAEVSPPQGLPSSFEPKCWCAPSIFLIYTASSYVPTILGGAYMLLVPLTISHSVHYILFERMFFFRNITSKGHKCIRIPHGNRFIFLWTVKILRTGKRSFFFKKQKLVGEYIHREKPSDTLGRHVFEWFFSAALFVYSIASPIHFSYPPHFLFSLLHNAPIDICLTLKNTTWMGQNKISFGTEHLQSLKCA